MQINKKKTKRKKKINRENKNKKLFFCSEQFFNLFCVAQSRFLLILFLFNSFYRIFSIENF